MFGHLTFLGRWSIYINFNFTGFQDMLDMLGINGMIGFCFTFGPTFLPWPFRSLGDQASGGTSLCHATLTVHGRTTKQPWKNGAKRRMSWRKYGAQGFGGNGMIVYDSYIIVLLWVWMGIIDHCTIPYYASETKRDDWVHPSINTGCVWKWGIPYTHEIVIEWKDNGEPEDLEVPWSTLLSDKAMKKRRVSTRFNGKK
jgi:hypothetical protein